MGNGAVRVDGSALGRGAGSDTCRRVDGQSFLGGAAHAAE